VIFEFNNNTFCLTVANSISPKTPLKKERKGIGMDTLKQRLQIVYAENYKLDSFVENNVYITHLKIDLFAHKVKMLTA
jgi:LytS/YehU family sensor histidine kinase